MEWMVRGRGPERIVLVAGLMKVLLVLAEILVYVLGLILILLRKIRWTPICLMLVVVGCHREKEIVVVGIVQTLQRSERGRLADERSGGPHSARNATRIARVLPIDCPQLRSCATLHDSLGLHRPLIAARAPQRCSLESVVVVVVD